MTTKQTRRPATVADLAAGSIVYRGNGKIAYRVFTVDAERQTVTASQTTTKSGTRPTWFYFRELTVAV
jgi:hypothetical protein